MLRKPLAIEAAWTIAAMALSLLVAVLVTELWQADLRVPIFPAGGDGNLTLSSLKGVIDHGWYESNSTLGAPFGQLNHDYPLYVGELGSVLEIKLLTLFFAHVAVIANAFVMLGFPLAALTAFLVLRRLGVARPVALTCAVLFAVAPFHLVRAQVHLFLANDWAIPIGAYLILATLGSEELFRRRAAANGWRSWLSAHTLTTLGLCVLVGIGGLYYAAFTCLLVAGSAALVAAITRRGRTLLSGAAIIAAIGLPVAATAAPEVLYRSEHGTNALVAKRAPAESLRYALPPIQLVLPIAHDRIPPLAKLRARYDADQGMIGTQGALPSDSPGLVATLGLMWLLVGVFAAALGKPWREPLARRGGAAALMAIMLGVTGGAGALFAYLVTPQIRAWDRIAILIAFFALIGVAVLLERALAALERRGLGRTMVAAVLVTTLGFGIFEGTTTRSVPPYAAFAAQWHADAAFVGEIQRVLPRNAMVLELPYVPYPEALANGLGSYAELAPYLHSTTLRWSAGAMKGRRTDWLARAAAKPVRQLITGAVAAGFTGVYVDRLGYPDRAAALAAQITALTGAPAVLESTGTALFFNLLPYAAKLRAELPAATLMAIADATTGTG